MHKNMIALLLALLLAGSALCSCGETKQQADTAGNGTETETTAGASSDETEKMRYTANVPDGTDLGGMKFTVLAYPSEDVIW